MKIINKVFMDTILLSIEGGLISIIFFIIQKKIYKYTSANFTVIVNIVAILCFVIPFFKILSFIDYTEIALYRNDLVIFIDENTLGETFYTTIRDISLANIITCIWLAGVIVYIIKGIISYIYFLLYIKKKCFILTDNIWLDCFKRIFYKENINKSVKLVTTNLLFQPCTTGFKSKIVIIPNHLLTSLSNEEIEIILMHELNHIKRNDISLKTFIYFLNSLNWFNPLIYLLKENLYELIEIRCDEDLLIYKDSKKKEMYANTLIKLNEIESIKKHQQTVTYFSSKGKYNLKKRIWCIMKKNNKGNRFSRALIFILTLCTIASATYIAKASNTTVNELFSNHNHIAYRDSYIIGENPELNNIHNKTEFIDFVEDSLLESTINDDNIFNIQNSDSNINYRIVFENNEDIDLTSYTQYSTQHVCESEKTNLTGHKRFSDGSCETIIYEALYCKICGKINKGNILQRNTSNPCKHQY